MYEVLKKRADETGADVVECGVFEEYQNKTNAPLRKEVLLSGQAIVASLLYGELSNAVWNKIWSCQCYKKIRFPEGKIFEEYATTWRVYSSVNTVLTLSYNGYHYVHRKGSLTDTYNLNNIESYWVSHKERYCYLVETVDDPLKLKLLRYCALAASRAWAYYHDCSPEDQVELNVVLKEMNSFSIQKLPLLGYRGWGPSLRVGVFFTHYFHPIAIRLAWLLNRIDKKCRRQRLQ